MSRQSDGDLLDALALAPTTEREHHYQLACRNALRYRHELALHLASPLRADRGAAIQRQHDASACPLFAAADQPVLL